MNKVGRPTGLIAYSTIRNVEDPKAGPRDGWRVIRPRTIIYASLMAFTTTLMVWAMTQRSTLDLTVIPDRQPLFVLRSDGGISNGYTIKVLNKLHDVRHVELSIEGLPEATVSLTGTESHAPLLDVHPDDLRAARVLVIVPRDVVRSFETTASPFRFVIKDTQDGTTTYRDTTFRSPAK